jgi:hypothetical protein
VRRTSCLRSLDLRRRLTNKKRPWNKPLIFSCMVSRLRAKRRAVVALDAGRPRLHFGFDVAKRRRSAATARRIPCVRSFRTWNA